MSDARPGDQPDVSTAARLFDEFLAGVEVEVAQASTVVTVEEIDGLDDDALRRRVAFRLFERFGREEWPGSGTPVLPRQWLATDAVEAEWLNGGLAQFVGNKGDQAATILVDAIAGYAMLGSSTMAQVATDVLDFVRSHSDPAAAAHTFEETPQGDVVFRSAERLAMLDDVAIDTSTERAAFVRAHPTDFIG